MSKITVASPLIVAAAKLTPAQRAAVWELAGFLDEKRIDAPDDPRSGDAKWVEMETKRLRGEHAREQDGWGPRKDNVWLRELLHRLEGVRLGGRASSDEWGGVLLAQWSIEKGGSIVRLLIPPGGLWALRTPTAFAKIDAEAVHRLPPHGQTLYALLADKKRQDIPAWKADLAELKAAFGVADKYVDKHNNFRFNDFHRRVLKPAVDAVNNFGVVKVTAKPERFGRSVGAVRFTWEWKTPAEAKKTAQENQRHSKARGKKQEATDAPPLIEQQRKWWHRLDGNRRAELEIEARKELGPQPPLRQVIEWAHQRENEDIDDTKEDK